MRAGRPSLLPIAAVAMLTLVLAVNGCVTPQKPGQETQAAAQEYTKPPGQRVHGDLSPKPPPTPPGIKEEPENGTAPPLPEGPFVPAPAGPTMPGTKGGEVDPSLMRLPQEDPPGDFRFFRNNTVSVVSASFLQTHEPSVAVHDDRQGAKAIFFTGNRYASVSTDDGASFAYLNPFTLFPASANGFCCDQRAFYEPSRDLYFWLLQYNTTGGCDGAAPPNCNGNNLYRIAVAHGAKAVVDGNWCYYDFTPPGPGNAGGNAI